jgi:RNA-binding protein 39
VIAIYYFFELAAVMDAAAVEEMLAAAAAASMREKEAKEGRGKSPTRNRGDSPGRRRERSGERRKRDRSGDRGNRRDRSPDRGDRGRYDRSPDRRRRDRSRSGDRYKRRSTDRRSSDRNGGRGRDDSRGRSPDRSRGARDRVREKSPEVDREELKRQREIDDLTKDQRTIFVSQLTKKTTEKDLERFFGEIGKVKNVIMLRDKVTGVHRGFAYVEMAELEHIPNCLLFNNVVPDFQKFPILVKASEAEKNFLAKKDPFSTTYEPAQAQVPGVDNSSPELRLYVGNIHISIDEAALRSVVETFGPVESVKLHRDNLGNSKGFAFVKFLTKDAAMKASLGLPGLEIMGRPLKIGPVIDANSHSVGPVGGPNEVSGNWKLDADEGGAGMALNSTSRIALMAKLGANAGLTVPMPVMPPAPLGAPMMTATGPAAGVVPPITGVPSVNLLVCNVFDPATETEPEWDLDIREDMLEECSKHGQVEHVHVEKRKPGGIVLLKFAAVDAASRAAQSLNGRFFAGRMITASFVDNATFDTLMM